MKKENSSGRKVTHALHMRFRTNSLYFVIILLFQCKWYILCNCVQVHFQCPLFNRRSSQCPLFNRRSSSSSMYLMHQYMFWSWDYTQSYLPERGVKSFLHCILHCLLWMFQCSVAFSCFFETFFEVVLSEDFFNLFIAVSHVLFESIHVVVCLRVFVLFQVPFVKTITALMCVSEYLMIQNLTVMLFTGILCRYALYLQRLIYCFPWFLLSLFPDGVIQCANMMHPVKIFW